MRYIPIGQAISAHGIQGEVRFRYYGEFEEDLRAYRTLYVELDGKTVELKPISVRRLKSLFLIRFMNIESHEKTLPLLNKELLVAEEDLPELEDGEYYDFQLTGMSVVNEHGEEIGHVDEVMHTAGGDILSIKGRTDLLVPMHEDFILDVDVDNYRIAVRQRPFLE